MVCFTKVAISVGCALALSFVFYDQKNLGEHAVVETAAVRLREKPTRTSTVLRKTTAEPAKRQQVVEGDVHPMRLGAPPQRFTTPIAQHSGAYGM